MTSGRRAFVALVVLALAAAALSSGIRYIWQAGWDARDQLVQKAEKAIEHKATKILVANTADAMAKQTATGEQIQAVNERAAAREKKISLHAQVIRKHEQPGSAHESKTTDPIVNVLGNCGLDADTVGVLNDARSDRDAAGDFGGTSSRVDEEVDASAEAEIIASGKELVQNDLEVVRLYHQLAIRHDGLVDWVNKQCLRGSTD